MDKQIRQALDAQFAPLTFTGRQQAAVLSRVKGEKNVKRKFSMAFVILAALAVMTATTAVAALGGDVLTYLYPRSTPTVQQQSSVQTLGVSAQVEDVRVTLTDCIYDGLRLSAGLVLEAAEPVYCFNITADSPVGPIWMDFASPVQTWNVNPVTKVFGEWDNTAHGFLAYLDEETIAAAAGLDRLPVTVTLECWRPAKGIKAVAAAPLWDSPERAAWQAAADALIAEGYTVVANGEAGFATVLPSSYGEGCRTIDQPLYMNLTPFEPITLTFEVDVRKHLDAVQDITPSEPITSGRFTYAFERVSLTPLTTAFYFTAAPNAPYTIEEMMDAPFWYDFFDENRQPLQYQDGEYMGGTSFQEQPDGSLIQTNEYPMPALARVPQGIYIVPEDADGAHWDDAVYVPVE